MAETRVQGDFSDTPGGRAEAQRWMDSKESEGYRMIQIVALRDTPEYADTPLAEIPDLLRYIMVETSPPQG